MHEKMTKKGVCPRCAGFEGGWGVCCMLVTVSVLSLCLQSLMRNIHPTFVVYLWRLFLKSLGSLRNKTFAILKRTTGTLKLLNVVWNKQNSSQRQVHASLCISCLDASGVHFLTQSRNEHSPSLKSLQPPRMVRPWLSVIHPPTPNSMAVSFYSKSPSSSADLVAPS